MIRSIHRWLLVLLYQCATKLRHRTVLWQKTLRKNLLPYAVNHQNKKWPESAKPVIPWETRLEDAKKSGNPIAPVKHRRQLNAISCPNCGAPKDYLYNFGYDNGHSADESFHKVRCKVCGFQTAPVRPKRKPRFRCPYCHSALEKVKQLKAFDVYKCRNKSCQYRLSKSIRAKSGANPKAKSYILRDFHLSLNELQLCHPHKPRVDFARIRHSTTAVALAVTFHIQMGLSLRETAFWLMQLYELPVSHQTIANWTQSVAFLLEHEAKATSDARILAGDETFIQIAGKDAFWNVSYDPESARVVTHHVSCRRDTQAANTLVKATVKSAPNMVAFVSDDWSPYALAIASLDESLGHIIVKGLKSRGLPEDAFLLYKDLLERFFRTFKQRYRRTLGFSNYNGAAAFCVLFVVYYNHFRPHTRLGGKTPTSLLKSQNVLGNWLQLIQMALKAA